MINELIASICLSTTSTFSDLNNTACNTTINAIMMQDQFKPKLEAFEKKTEDKYREQVLEVTGKAPWAIAGAYYSVFYQKQIVFSTDLKPIANSADVVLRPTEQALKLNWNWGF